MSFKSIMAASLVLVSLGAQARPPVPPSAIIQDIRSLSLSDCTTNEGGIAVSDLRDNDSIKFVLQVKRSTKTGILSVIQDGKIIENFEVTCK